MNLAIFDLDNTLLNGDSDYLWGRFLVQAGIVDGASYERQNRASYDDYCAGNLDIFEFLRFSLRPLAQNDLSLLLDLRRQFIAEYITPIIPPATRHLLDQHRRQGHTLLIITATNRFVTEPIAEALAVDDLIATDPEFIGNRYTGQVSGIPSFREGKVQRLEDWLTQRGANLASSWFYSDSHNDLPLLEMVTHPVAVDPDDTLAQHAAMKGWPIVTLRQGDRPAPLTEMI